MTAKQEIPFLDKHHRSINYLRLSVTDRCNLRCVYCMPEEGISFLPREEILTYEDMLHLVKLCVANGIRKIRLTGGEPLVRKGSIHFIEKLSRIKELKEITLTTNGVLLKEYAHDLRKYGICRINVSMDTLKPEKFNAITRRPLFQRVWEGIEAAEAVGMAPIKLNVVAMKGFNDDEILDFARLTYGKPYHVRFIEMMPIGAADARMKGFISSQEILERISSLGPLHRLESEWMAGPAEMYALEGAKGKIGGIGALSHHFRATCNRLRLTADGQLRGCLFSDRETDLKTPLRQGKDDDYLSDLIRYPQCSRKLDELALKYDLKYHATARIIDKGHAMMFAFSFTFNRADGDMLERTRKALSEASEYALSIGGLFWKPTLDEQRIALEKMDPQTAKLMKMIKGNLDPQGIMNPGNWEGA